MTAEGSKRWKEKNRDKYNEYMRGWRARNREHLRSETAKRLYGISLEEADELRAGPCAICKGQAQHVDHDHATGQIRGGLCSECNTGQVSRQPDAATRSRCLP